MFDKMIGFIGAGNMGSAMIGGILASSFASTGQIIASASSVTTLEKIKNKFSVETTLSNETVARQSDILFLAVKPNKFDDIIPTICDCVKSRTIIVSIAAGKTISAIEQSFGRKIKLVRAMPNTPALVGEAMSALCCNANVTSDEMEQVKTIFQCFGKCEYVPESLFDAVIGVSGSSPAYVFLMLEAMADAAVADGMPRKSAYKFAAQAVLGAAKMVLATEEHPGLLKDAVCSPGGTTIEAVAALEESGFRSAIIQAQRACSAKSRAMNKTQ